MILSQTLGDDFYRLNEDDLGRLNTAIQAELIRNPEIHRLVQQAAHSALRASGKRPSGKK